MRTLPPVLSIAGSDNSAGAGIQADLKTMSALGVYGLTAVTCVVAEVPGKVSAVAGMEPGLVVEQIRLLFEAFPVAAVKTGMLYATPIVGAVVGELERQAACGAGVPLVVDPVMVATSGARLLEAAAVAAYRERLLPLATVVTPNLDEAAVLWGAEIASRAGMREAGQDLVREFGVAFLVKGGHLREGVAADLLVEPGGGETWFEAPFVEGVSTHGTGCTYSAAIAAELGKGRSLREAVAVAKTFVTRAVSGFLQWHSGSSRTDALHHFAPE